MAVIAARLAGASPAFGLEGIVALALERWGLALGLPPGTAEMLTLLKTGTRPLETLLLPDDEFRALVERVQEELGGV